MSLSSRYRASRLTRRQARVFACCRVVASVLVVGFGLQGCLYTSHHLNTGRLVEPGKSHWEFGVGAQSLGEGGCSEEQSLASYMRLQEKRKTLPNLDRDFIPSEYYSSDLTTDAKGNPVCEVSLFLGQDTVTHRYVTLADSFGVVTRRTHLINYSLGWRVGVRKEWGPFTGVDLGWRLEAPTGPATLEFDTRFGLPLPQGLSDWRHAASLGWGIGMWADNSLFAEYAFGRSSGTWRPFANTRLTYLASQPMDLVADGDFTRFDAKRRWVVQAHAGLECILPDIALLPLRILPSVGIVYPSLPFYVESGHYPGDGLEWRVALGLAWSL